MVETSRFSKFLWERTIGGGRDGIFVSTHISESEETGLVGRIRHGVIVGLVRLVVAGEVELQSEIDVVVRQRVEDPLRGALGDVGVVPEGE